MEPFTLHTIKRYKELLEDKRNEESAELNTILEERKYKEAPELVFIDDFSFNHNTRVCQVSFSIIKHYRTIVKYVTQNYVRYPIYSDWKVKNKTVQKRIVLTNIMLERLDSHDDDLISSFASEIITRLNSTSLSPSWYIDELLTTEHDEEIKRLESQKTDIIQAHEKEIKPLQDLIQDHNTVIAKYDKIKSKYSNKVSKLDNTINRIMSAKRSFLLALLTFGIRGYLLSNARKSKLAKRKAKLFTKIERVNTKRENELNKINEIQANINALSLEYNQSIQKIDTAIAKEEREYSTELSKIVPLTLIGTSDRFIPLKEFIWTPYKKIVGVYVIRNTENNKVYVGQSKDVMKRIKQHFNGTEPRNIIFANDYFNSKLQDKADIFEIRTKKLRTKDELDKTEKQLIEYYDSFHNGYNNTNGNN